MARQRISLDSAGAWIEQARQKPSPNFDQRPEGQHPELIVVHAISLPPNRFGGSFIDQLFCNELDPGAHSYFAEICDLRVSAHALIRRDGELVQYVPLTHRAWHAGESSFGGRSCCNDFSIGIELEGSDERPFEAIQYRQLAALALAIRESWPLTASNPLQGHSDIAPGRKTDPGPYFKWSSLEQEMRNCMAETDPGGKPA